jgi:hypothetical protein
MTNPNRMRLPPRKSLQFVQGWRACEAGKGLTDNPYHTNGGAYARDWVAGHNARADKGFSVDHLPRLPSGAFSD